jgi:hypothetical protein
MALCSKHELRNSLGMSCLACTVDMLSDSRALLKTQNNLYSKTHNDLCFAAEAAQARVVALEAVVKKADRMHEEMGYLNGTAAGCLEYAKARAALDEGEK